jgi:ornithine cyclodeaminase
MGVMPGYLADPPCYGVKLVSLFPGNPARGLSSHRGAVVLFEVETGGPVAMLDAGALTAIRTAAASAVATRVLAREDASVLALIGCGEQAEHHLDAMQAVRPITHVRVVGRSAETAGRFAADALARFPALNIQSGTDVEGAVTGADIICTVTSSDKPVLQGDWLEPGQHLNVVGASIPSKREVDDAAILRAHLVVDYRPSTFAQAGEIVDMIAQGRIDAAHVKAEIGEVLSGQAPGRTDPRQITLYRSLGIAAQDLAAAHEIVAAHTANAKPDPT